MLIIELRLKYPLKPCLKVLQVSRNQYYYWSKRIKDKDPDEELKKEIKRISGAYPFYGFKRIYAILRGRGYKVNHKKVRRIYREMILQIPISIRRPRKLNKDFFAKELTEAEYVNHVWSEDFLKSFLEDGRGFRIYLAIDIKTREIVGSSIDISIPSSKVIEALNEAFLKHGKPKIIRSDNGPEFRSKEMGKFLFNERIQREFIEKGKPYQNGHVESTIDKIKKEFFNRYSFNTIEEVKREWERYIEFFNNERPHQSLNYKTPKEVRDASTYSLLMNV